MDIDQFIIVVGLPTIWPVKDNNLTIVALPVAQHVEREA